MQATIGQRNEGHDRYSFPKSRTTTARWAKPGIFPGLPVSFLGVLGKFLGELSGKLPGVFLRLLGKLLGLPGMREASQCGDGDECGKSWPDADESVAMRTSGE